MLYDRGIEMMKHADRRLETHFGKTTSVEDVSFKTLKKTNSAYGGAAVHVHTAGLVSSHPFLRG